MSPGDDANAWLWFRTAGAEQHSVKIDPVIPCVLEFVACHTNPLPCSCRTHALIRRLDCRMYRIVVGGLCTLLAWPRACVWLVPSLQESG